jgi:Tfp pilus assembly protein PilV
MSYKTRTKLSGFSLGEVVLAGFVLTVGLLSISALITKSLQNSFENRDAITAILLAQEGVELVRNVRDNNLAAGGTGFVAFFDSISNRKHCRISYNDIFSYSDANTVNQKLDCAVSQGSTSRYNLGYTASGFYQHDAGNGKFSRYIYIEDKTSGGDINYLVRSFVYWGGGASGAFKLLDTGANGDITKCSIVKKCVFTEVNLTNWK